MHSPRLYEQAVAAVQEYIQRHSLSEGSKLPSARELAALLGYNRAPLHQALLLLATQNRLLRLGNSFVVQSPRPTELQQVLCNSVTGPRPQFLEAIRKAGAKYGIRLKEHIVYSPEEELALIERIGKEAPLLVAMNEAVLPETDELLQSMAASGWPLVGCFNPPPKISAVLLDIQAATQAAFNYLVDSGHKHLAFLHRERGGKVLTQAAVAAYRQACLAREMGASAARIFDTSVVQDELTFQGATNQILQLINLYKSKVSGLICVEETTALEAIINAEQMGLHVPADLSVISLQRGTRSDARGLTVCSGSAENVATMAVSLLKHQIAEPRSVIRVAVQPDFFQGNTVGFYHRQLLNLTPNNPAPLMVPPEPAIPAYPADLSEFVTRSYRQAEKGWFGHYGLTQLAPGCRVFAKYPFHIIDESKNRGKGAIVLRSKRVQSMGRNKLPSRVVVPIQQVCNKVVILHAAGWVTSHCVLGEYIMHHQTMGNTIKPIVAYHSDPPDESSESTWRKESSVQDWWPDLPQFETESVHPISVGVETLPVYLYVMEWTNPYPEDLLESVEFRSVPTKQGTLAILALTLVQEQQ